MVGGVGQRAALRARSESLAAKRRLLQLRRRRRRAPLVSSLSTVQPPGPHARARTGPRTAACDARLIKRSAGVAYICATVADIRQPAARLSVGVVRKTGRLLAAQTSDSTSVGLHQPPLTSYNKSSGVRDTELVVESAVWTHGERP